MYIILNRTQEYWTNQNHSSTQGTCKWSPTQLSGILTKQLHILAHASKIGAFGVNSCFLSISKNRKSENFGKSRNCNWILMRENTK